MCGNCHTINLPLMDNPEADLNKPHLEQLTYLEWLNSGYQNEVGTNSKAQTCQDCHMPTKYSNSKGTLNISLIQQPIAFIEDDQYPQTGNRLPDECDAVGDVSTVHVALQIKRQQHSRQRYFGSQTKRLHVRA
jgi:hypothetical protein